MMRIDDLLLAEPAVRWHASLPETNPLTQEDALQEAQVLDVRFDALTGVAGILFELRQALQLHEANTGVLIARGVRELTWSGPARGGALTAWSVGSSVPSARNRIFGMSLILWPHPGARLAFTAVSAAFFVGEVPGLPESPPDYGLADRRAVDSDVARWDSLFEPISGVFVDPVARD